MSYFEEAGSLSLDNLVSKRISSYSFGRIAFKIHTGIKYDNTHLGCAFFDDRTIFGEFLKF